MSLRTTILILVALAISAFGVWKAFNAYLGQNLEPANVLLELSKPEDDGCLSLPQNYMDIGITRDGRAYYGGALIRPDQVMHEVEIMQQKHEKVIVLLLLDSKKNSDLAVQFAKYAKRAGADVEIAGVEVPEIDVIINAPDTKHAGVKPENDSIKATE